MEIVIHINDSSTTVEPAGGDSSTAISGSLRPSATAKAASDIDAGPAPAPPSATGAPSRNVVGHGATATVRQGDQSAGAAPFLT